MTDKDKALRLALEYVELVPDDRYNAEHIDQDALITAIKAALSGEAQTRSVVKDEPVGLIESLKDAKPCCGQYETCWRACTPRGKFIGQRDAQRKPLTDEEIQDALEAEFLGSDAKRNWQDDLRVARAIEAAHGIIDPTDLKGKHDA